MLETAEDARSIVSQIRAAILDKKMGSDAPQTGCPRPISADVQPSSKLSF
jgi:hypothetical protein